MSRRSVHGHWKTTTLIAWLRLSGIDAPMALDRRINDEIFLAYVQRVLVLSLRLGDIGLMDNLGINKGAALRQLRS